jgi:hypothetical protein
MVAAFARAADSRVAAREDGSCSSGQSAHRRRGGGGNTETENGGSSGKLDRLIESRPACCWLTRPAWGRLEAGRSHPLKTSPAEPIKAAIVAAAAAAAAASGVHAEPVEAHAGETSVLF